MRPNQDISREQPNDDIEIDKEIAQSIINSKERAEVFISGFMKRHGVDRESALKQLRLLGINLAYLPE